MKKQLYLFAFTAMALVFIAASPVPNVATVVPESSKITKQQNSDFAFFRTHRQTRYGITATWGMTSEAGVESFLVKRTYEDPTDPYSNWELIATIPSTSARFYRYTDLNLLPGVISYRIEVVMKDGSSVPPSDYSSIQIRSHG